MNILEKVEITRFNRRIVAGTPIRLTRRSDSMPVPQVEIGVVMENNGLILVYSTYSKQLKKVKTYDLSISMAQHYDIEVGTMVFKDE
jgi:hypothetical protein